jgi:hypothetical protein
MRTGQEVDRVMALRAERLNACAFGRLSVARRASVALLDEFVESRR